MNADVRLLRDRNLLVSDPEGGVAVIGPTGWQALPEPLAGLVRRALSTDDDDDAA